MAHISDVKAQIKTYLDELVTATILGKAESDDYQQGIFDRDFSAFPVAILQTASIESDILTTVEDLRTFNFEIVVIQRAENITAATDIETLQEAILDKFAQNQTLNNTCQKQVPAVSAPAPVLSRGKSYVAFSVMIKAQKLKTIT